MKANRTALSSTFWLINKRNEAPTSSCDYRVTELDVTENVGIDAYPDSPDNRNWVDQNIRSINSNSHSRRAPNAQQCGTNLGIEGDKTPIGEEAWRDYHVYGVWWKNATELIFFLDGQEAHRVTPAEDFDLGMYLRMVVESYTWNNPRDGFDNKTLPVEDRTTYYDWTRSWKLVDETNEADSDDDGVNDSADNCTNTANPSQFDADGDGYGNRCDGDFNNDCVVNATDLGLMRADFFTDAANRDLNDDGVVNVVDLGLLRTMFFQAPGPAATGECP